MAVSFPDEIHPKYGMKVRFDFISRPQQYLEYFDIVEVCPSCKFVPLDLLFDDHLALDEYLKGRGIVYDEVTVDSYSNIKKKTYCVDSKKIYEVEDGVSKYLLRYKYYSINEVADMLSFSRPTVYKFINDMSIKFSRINGQVRIRHSDLVDFITKENAK